MADKLCVCSGIRKCLVCENGSRRDIENERNDDMMQESKSTQDTRVFHYCLETEHVIQNCWVECAFCRPGQKTNRNSTVLQKTEGNNEQKGEKEDDLTAAPISEHSTQPECDKNSDIKANTFGIDDCITVLEDFVTHEEEIKLKEAIYKFPWKLSQSGRRKQDFGPQANFKKKKLKVGNFTGLPSVSRDIVKRFKCYKELSNFDPVEVCHLEYTPERGSSIDPHIDDEWLWGERLVTLNLCSNSILTLSNENLSAELTIQVPMPQRSLLVLQGDARHIWKHSIKRNDVNGLRLAITFRELSDEFTVGKQADLGEEILKIASTFKGKPLYNGERSNNCT
eukprot:Seg1566.9 transcript_id=Seg1566.9/GoldUCD/mRNA.D3Y31 product="alpha-ketoglutarate-dependent dioxygenase alkB 4" protein_id=Seg1566.9/GoldUCD/D3Y31